MNILKEFLSLKNPVAILYAIVVIPTVAIITLAVCMLREIGLLLIWPAEAWRDWHERTFGE